MKLKVMVVVVSLMFVASVQAEAITYSGAPVYSAGSGANTARVAVDFGTASYVFDYSWDGTATSWDALHAVDLAGDLTVNATMHPTWGAFVSKLSYPGATTFNYGMQGTGWSYFVSTDGLSWAEPSNGLSFNPISNGDWNAWVWSNYDENWNVVRHPGEAPMTAPEPVTLVLMGAGGLFLRRRMA